MSQQNITKLRGLFQISRLFNLFPGVRENIIARGSDVGNTSERVIIILFFWGCLGALTPARASDLQAWIDVSDFFDLTENLQVGGDAGFRQSTECDRFSAFYGRPTLNYRFNPTVAVMGGVGLFYVWEPLTVLETRPWVGLLIQYPRVSRVSFSHLIRLEERLFDIKALDDLLEIGRLRYRLKAVIPLNRPADQAGSWYVPVYFEVGSRVWGDLPTGFISAARFSLGLGYRVNKDWRLELNYHQQQEKLTKDGSLTIGEHLVRLQIRGW